MTANANKLLQEILLKCVRQYKKVYVKIHQTVNAIKKLFAHQDSNVKRVVAKIFARTLSADQELLVV